MFKKYACTMQHDQSDCAAAVVSTVLLSYKKELSIMKIREIIGTDMYGTTVSGIVSGLEKLNFTVKAVRVAQEDFESNPDYLPLHDFMEHTHKYQQTSN